MPTEPIVAPETYQEYRPRLNDGNNMFRCSNCGHHAGDPRSENFLARCYDCGILVRFRRIIE